jgi:phenylpropionate dioxygenase-like ring-hydroxylating dioxygenase large terminal subunit
VLETVSPAKHRKSAASLGIDLAKVRADLSENKSLPISTFLSKDVYDFELATIFEGTWQYFVPTTSVSEPGMVATGTVGSVPIVVARGQDGKLHGSVNVCRHRAYTVVDEGTTHCKNLRCKYHQWVYRLDGSLLRAPDVEEDAGFDKSEYGLLPISVEEWGPAVFVNTDPNAPSLLTAMPQLDHFADLRGFNRSIDDYEFHSVYIKEMQANWKLWYDNGVECYHCASIHPDTFFAAFQTTTGDKQDSKQSGLVLSSNFEAPDVPRAGLPPATYCKTIWPFPGGMFVQQDDMMMLSRMTPTGPDSCKFIAHYFGEKGSDPKNTDFWVDIYCKTFDEDAQAVEVQQRNLGTSGLPNFRYSQKREHPNIYVARLICDFYEKSLT